MREPLLSQKPPKKPLRDPTAASRTWAIALVVSGVFLVAAIAVVVWIVMGRASSGGQGNVVRDPGDPAVGVKNVTFELPAELSTSYTSYDQSKVGERLTFYDDSSAGCSIVLGVLPLEAQKSPQDIVVSRLSGAFTQGVNTTKITLSERFVLLDTDPTKSYSFETIEMDQEVNVSGVGFTARHQRVGFKKIGDQIVAVGYGCKAETWAEKQSGLLTAISGITLKTER